MKLSCLVQCFHIAGACRTCIADVSEFEVVLALQASKIALNMASHERIVRNLIIVVERVTIHLNFDEQRDKQPSRATPI